MNTEIDVLAVEAAYRRDSAANVLAFQQGEVSFAEWQRVHNEIVARYWDALARIGGAS